MELDMTKGKPMGLMLRFLIPVAIGNIFQQLYNTVDSIIVGRFVGVGALAAVGSTGTIMFLILGFLSGLTSGFTVLVSQRFGAGDIKGMKRAVGNAALLAVIVSAVMTFFSMVFMKQLLTLMNTPADIYQDAAILQQASEAVHHVLDDDPDLEKEEHYALKVQMDHFMENQLKRMSL